MNEINATFTFIATDADGEIWEDLREKAGCFAGNNRFMDARFKRLEQTDEEGHQIWLKETDGSWEELGHFEIEIASDLESEREWAFNYQRTRISHAFGDYLMLSKTCELLPEIERIIGQMLGALYEVDKIYCIFEK